VIVSDHFVDRSHALVMFLLKICPVFKQQIQTIKVVKECCYVSGNPTIRILSVYQLFCVWQVFENEVH